MNGAERAAATAALNAAFGGARDVSLNEDQPLTVILHTLRLPAPWSSPAEALVRFAGWPKSRPEFLISPDVKNASGNAPKSNSEVVVLGRSWRQFSFSFPWDPEQADIVESVERWLTRFRLAE
jgi:hypothetical protein